ncbi:UDP-glucose 4-epimerase GalE, partial [bacterium]|nr:UDP-glucose 4-epimerase GalE [bacterium]
LDAVIHFAAYSQVGESVRDPQKYYMNNVYGSLNLLNQMIKHNVDKIVFSSTAATYGNPITETIDENHPQNPINPYGKTKLTIERMMDDYREPYGIRSARLRYFNVAGADSQGRVGEWHEPETHIIPKALKAAISGNPFPLYGDDYKTPDGTCIRDYINVEDLANAHLLALDYLDKGGETDFFNLGTNTGNSVKEVIDECEDVTGRKINIEMNGRRAGDPDRLVANNAKAKRVLNWNPQRDLRYSIETAYNWEKNRGKVTQPLG